VQTELITFCIHKKGHKADLGADLSGWYDQFAARGLDAIGDCLN